MKVHEIGRKALEDLLQSKYLDYYRYVEEDEGEYLIVQAVSWFGEMSHYISIAYRLKDGKKALAMADTMNRNTLEWMKDGVITSAVICEVWHVVEDARPFEDITIRRYFVSVRERSSCSGKETSLEMTFENEKDARLCAKSLIKLKSVLMTDLWVGTFNQYRGAREWPLEKYTNNIYPDCPFRASRW